MSRSYRHNVWLDAGFFGDPIKKKTLRTKKIDFKCGSNVDDCIDEYDDEIVSSSLAMYRKREGQTHRRCTREIFFQIPKKHFYHGIPIRMTDKDMLTEEFDRCFYIIMQANC